MADCRLRNLLHHIAYTVTHEQALLARASDEYLRIKAICEREARYGNFRVTIPPSIEVTPQLLRMLSDAGIYESEDAQGLHLSWIQANRTSLLTGRDLIDAGYVYDEIGPIQRALSRAIAEGRVAHTVQAELFWVKEYMKATLSD
jgi:hypothetical protein